MDEVSIAILILLLRSFCNEYLTHKITTVLCSGCYKQCFIAWCSDERGARPRIEFSGSCPVQFIQAFQPSVLVNLYGQNDKALLISLSFWSDTYANHLHDAMWKYLLIHDESKTAAHY